MSLIKLKKVQFGNTKQSFFFEQLYPTILYTIQSNNGTLAIKDEYTYWVLKDQVKQLLSLGTAGVLVRTVSKNINCLEIRYHRICFSLTLHFPNFLFLLFQTMAMMGLNMIRAWGITTTTDYFVNGFFGGISQDLGKTTMEILCNAINDGDKESFGLILSNNGSASIASLSFPVGRTYTDINLAWNAVYGINIQITGDINSSGMFTAVPVYLLLPFTKDFKETRSNNQYVSSIIRMEFETSSDMQPKLVEASTEITGNAGALFPNRKQSYILKSVEFFFDF